VWGTVPPNTERQAAVFEQRTAVAGESSRGFLVGSFVLRWFGQSQSPIIAGKSKVVRPLVHYLWPDDFRLIQSIIQSFNH
jgi:hypothetical protein